MKLRYIAIFLTACLWVLPLWAQEATPNHVYRSVEMIRQELALLNEANFSETGDIIPQRTDSLPRHVLQRARIIWTKVQLLRFMNGLPTGSLEPMEVRDVRPADVKGVVDSILADVRELRPAYSVTAVVAEPDLPTGKTPTDVLMLLEQVNHEIDALGVPGTVPNDVYQVAVMLVRDLEAIAEGADVVVDLAAVEMEQGKNPADAYRNAHALIDDLRTLSDQGDAFSIPGGIATPLLKSAGITPADVIELLGRGLAEVGAMKHAAGVGQTTPFVPLEGGRTPSDVYHAIAQARSIVSALSRSGGNG